jgi:hypothetical protein
MRQLAKEYPDDLDAQVLFAESLMNTMPWDYWTRDRPPKPETEEILSALRFVMSRDPDHPGANHFYIHAVEAGPTPELGLPAADRLRTYAPAAGHLVHMPAHIYIRVGQYSDAVTANQLAIKADKEYIRHCRAQGFYPGAYYPHNIHFLWWALLLDGRSKDSLRVANQAAAYASDNYCGPSKAVEAPRLRFLPWLTLARFGRWDEVLDIAQPPATNDFLVDRALWHYTRGLALVAKKQPDAAGASTPHSPPLPLAKKPKNSAARFSPVADALGVAATFLGGRVAGASGKTTDSIEQLQKAVALADAIPYMEPAYWPIPVRPTLGAALLQPGNPPKPSRFSGGPTSLAAQWLEPARPRTSSPGPGPIGASRRCPASIQGRVVTGRREARSGMVLTDRRRIQGTPAALAWADASRFFDRFSPGLRM